MTSATTTVAAFEKVKQKEGTDAVIPIKTGWKIKVSKDSIHSTIPVKYVANTIVPLL